MLTMCLSGDAAFAARRALYTVALCDGALEPREQQMLSMEGELDAPGAALSVITPEALREAITDPQSRRALVQRMVLMSALDEALHPEELAAVRSFAKALEVEEPGVAQLELLAKGKIRTLGFELMRKGFIARQLKKEWRVRGLRGVWAMALAARGSRALAARYQALQALPQESLGHALYRYYQENKFAMPGEAHGPPEAMLFHDLGHVLTGYTTSPRGEIQMVGLEAGYMREDGFSVVILGLLLFHYGEVFPGIQATPAKGMFDLPLFQEAYQRGLALHQDLRDFVFWEHAEAPLAQVRSAVGLA